MNVEINGHPHELSTGTTLVGLLQGLGGSTRGSAAVVDGEVVPRAEWSTFEVREGQAIEVITAVQGG